MALLKVLKFLGSCSENKCTAMVWDARVRAFVKAARAMDGELRISNLRQRNTREIRGRYEGDTEKMHMKSSIMTKASSTCQRSTRCQATNLCQCSPRSRAVSYES